MEMKLKAQNLKRKTTTQNFKLLNLILWLYVLTFALYPSPASAEVKIGEKFGFGDITSLGDATSKLVDPIFSIAAALVVIYFLWGAFKWLKSGGNKEEVAGARQIITHSIIGFIILMFAFFLLQFIPQFFGLTGLDIVR